VLGDFVKTGSGGINGFVEFGIIYAELPRVDSDDGTYFTFRNLELSMREKSKFTIFLM
jgi:hypothetical protein